MPRSSPGHAREGNPREALDALFAAGNADPLRRALWLDALERRLRPLLPPALAAHARFANVDGGRLVFLVDSPVWKARLRLASAELLDAARSVGLACDEVVVKVATTPLAPAPPASRRPVPLSAATREALEAALASLKDGS
jgi:Dna[CI] antecedent DciA-like protein